MPTGIATDETTKEFFSYLLAQNNLVSLIGFINSKKIFAGIKDYIKFALVTLGQSEKAYFAFNLTSIEDIRDEKRIFTLTKDDLRLLNPNTQTCPVFRTKFDAIITKDIYLKVPVLINEVTGMNIWQIGFRQGPFNMTSDSNLFLTEAESGSVPLYEAKLFHIFDHRFSTYENATAENINEGNLPQFTDVMHQDPNHLVLTRYWVKEPNFKDRIVTKRNWAICFRLITGNASERTVIFSIVPHVAFGHSLSLVIVDNKESELVVSHRE